MEGFYPVIIQKTDSSIRALVNGTEIKSGQNWDVAVFNQETKIGFISTVYPNPFGPEMKSMCFGTLEHMGEEVKITEGLLLRQSDPAGPIKAFG